MCACVVVLTHLCVRPNPNEWDIPLEVINSYSGTAALFLSPAILFGSLRPTIPAPASFALVRDGSWM